MSAPSFTTVATAGPYAKMLSGKRPDMEINIDDHNEAKIYTTFDAINGHVSITAPQNARFDEIHITFEGSTKTYIDNMSPASSKSRTSAHHNFLKLTMPISEADYPLPRIAEAGRTYTFPFNFVIPDRLLPTSCAHQKEDDHVHEAHVQLPPSIGDILFTGKDDLSPEMVKIQYCIKVKVTSIRESDSKKMTVTEGTRKVHVIPAVVEAPPMSISVDDKDYTMSKSKSLRKGMFSGKLGKITVSAAQTAPFTLPNPSSLNAGPASTTATVSLRFDPHESSLQPPRLGGLTSKLKALTFFSVKPARVIASRAMMSTDYEMSRGVFTTSVPLSSRCVENVAWKKHEPKSIYQRRDSDLSTSSSDLSDSATTPLHDERKVYYTATIVFPLSLPSSKAWVPSFHGCIASRVYFLDLSLSIHTPGTGVPATTASLRLPVQIAAEGNQSAPAPLSAAEAAAELAQANAFLTPRIIEAPSEELIGNSVLRHNVPELPPSYEDFLDVVSPRTVASMV
ncbi:hypothetical protein BP6252_07166 [Coleophoma cylindrospora]|uniref:Arrestin-like N-terminal domain-containing protein n=1 Tax=Coleophoma cylindrospora TaxID=1849047 RepID=A0A3D8RGT1_9HELO|nr:hypothetical protein BP6252_07166 [Coleophoma cylindrospora]